MGNNIFLDLNIPLLCGEGEEKNEEIDGLNDSIKTFNSTRNKFNCSPGTVRVGRRTSNSIAIEIIQQVGLEWVSCTVIEFTNAPSPDEITVIWALYNCKSHE